MPLGFYLLLRLLATSLPHRIVVNTGGAQEGADEKKEHKTQCQQVQRPKNVIGINLYEVNRLNLHSNESRKCLDEESWREKRVKW